MTSTWSLLVDELDEWRRRGLLATFWLRDDDAFQASSKLDRLLEVVNRIPLALAVIPSRADESLVAAVRFIPTVRVWQHGWTHRNWGADPASEYPKSRNPNEVAAELALGKEILQRLFGPQSQAVFVPPWSGFAPEYLSILGKLKFLALSGASPRRFKKSNGVAIVNGHAELIEWTEPPSFADEDVYLKQILDHLKGRRTFRYDYAEPTGIIWHHQCQDDRSYQFLQKLIEVVGAHPAAAWVDPTFGLKSLRGKPFVRALKPGADGTDRAKAS